MKYNTKILILLGWRTTKDSGLLSEKHNLDVSSLPYGMVLHTDAERGAEYFGIKLMEVEECDLRGSNSINYLDVPEKYGSLFDALAKMKVHIDYKIGRARIWCIPIIN